MPNLKEVRKQLHNILQDNPDLLKNEIYKAAFDQLRTEITARLQMIEGSIKQSLEQMETRQKDMHSMLTRAAFAATSIEPKTSPDQYTGDMLMMKGEGGTVEITEVSSGATSETRD